MAERRMFSKSVIWCDMFLEMPLSSQALYMHLNMSAADDGLQVILKIRSSHKYDD